MPQGEWEKSLVANGYPLLPDDAQIVLQDDVGVDNPLDATEVSIVPRRELVSLDNASVNIDNSNDVIIGPVTQFNVTGNVIIRQRENERPSQGEDNEGDGVKSKTGVLSKQSKQNTTWFHLLLVTIDQNRRLVRNATLIATILLVVLVIAVILLKKLLSQLEFDEVPYYGDQLGNHTIFYRQKWGGSPSKSSAVKLQHPVPLIIISHSQTRSCGYLETCSERMQYLQKFHQVYFKTPDIGYNFAIGGDSNIYVGRGWDFENMHRKNSIGIDFIGDYEYDVVSGDMIKAAQLLIQQGLQLKKIAEDYIVVGENQTNPRMFLSPGEHVYDVIKSWPRFYNKTMF